VPIATPEVYAEMLNRAKEGKFAYPAINVTSSQTVTAALQGFAEAESDGIIQVSVGGAEYGSGSTIKNRVTGSLALAAYAEENGHTLVNVIWYSSTTEVWGRTEKLKGYIDEYHPDYIFVSLGGNELFVSNIRDRRQKYLNHILSQIGNIPFVWIGPPNWKPDTGINEMLAETIGPGRFYLSYTPDQHYDRARDGAHPTRASAAAWMDRVCAWVMRESAHRIVLHRPKAARAHCHTVILAPAK